MAVVRDAVIVDVHGVGYELFVPPGAIPSLVGEESEKQTWHVFMVVREDTQQLYGFRSLEDRELFALLTSVSGVGPKTALGVMNYGAQAVVAAVQQANVAFFQAVPRLGKKIAQKIILELQSKLGEKGALSFTPLSANLQDIETALVEMGLPSEQVTACVAKLDPETDVSTGIKIVLQELRGGKHGR